MAQSAAVPKLSEGCLRDDWRTALGVVLALALTALLAEAAISDWWVMPLAALALLALSIRRAAPGAEDESGVVACL
jgi:hypothetical protein